jgi:23S rRNA pseudouridine1911/1915/1917 synthase
MAAIKITTSDTEVGKRLDVFLSEREEIESRSLATKLIQQGHVKIAGKNKLKASTKLEEGLEIEITLPEAKDMGLSEYDFPLDIVFEDEHLFVINKPAGLVVHPAAGHADDTLVNALMNYSKDFHIGLDEQRPGIVHRLDKDTSGLLVVAKDNKSLEKLSDDFANRNIKRFYWAVCIGNPKFENLVIESPIGRHISNRKKMSSNTKHGKEAKTELWKLGNYHEKLCLLKFKLYTGRTHQIRVHASENHFPILADELYSSINRLKGILSPQQIAEIKKLERFFLHAAVLGFEHPITGETMEFYAPPPSELIPVLERYDFIKDIEKEFGK